ncbi:MAG: hypothetical protein HY645_10665 [Acidobacteria bacterium]|nr:hypothetical protein [Acidobacteriota bacterium]
MNDGKDRAVLFFAVLLILLGLFSLGITLDLLRWPRWWDLPNSLLLQAALGLLIIGMATVRLYRHFAWQEERLSRETRKAGLLGGIFWGLAGITILLDAFEILDGLTFFGRYWPLILVLFGMGKIIDFYRIKGQLQFRFVELLQLLLVIFAGLAAASLARSPVHFLDFHFPVEIGDHISLPQKSFRWTEKRSYPVQRTESLEITNDWGDITVEAAGQEEITIELVRQIFEGSEDAARSIAKAIVLKVEPRESVLKISSTLSPGLKPGRARGHLHLRVPARLYVTAATHRGRIVLRNLQEGCRVENAYGPVVADSLQGSVHIDNRYGPVEVKGSSGKLEIRNRRGSILAEDISGSVHLQTDYDSITARRITGDFVGKNHFGELRVEDVSGTCTVAAPGSKVVLDRVRGNSTVENSHRSLRASQIQSAFNVSTSYSTVELEQIAGALTLQAAHSRLRGRALSGGVKVQAVGTAVSLSEVSGPLEIQTSLQQVKLDDFRGTTRIQNEYSDIVISSREILHNQLQASNRNGNITLILPPHSPFRFSAEAPGGRIISDFGQTRSRDVGQVFRESFGTGGPEIRLQTLHSDIHLKKRG